MAQANIRKPPGNRKPTKGVPPSRDQVSRNLQTTAPVETAQLNFTVPRSFKDDFKDYADERGMKMVAVLYKAFALLRAQEA